MIYESIERNWEKTKETKCVCVELVTGRPSLFSSMVKSFGFPFFMASILKLIHDICQFVGPVMLSKVIDFLEDDDPNLPKVGIPIPYSFSEHRLHLRSDHVRCSHGSERVFAKLLLPVFPHGSPSPFIGNNHGVCVETLYSLGTTNHYV